MVSDLGVSREHAELRKSVTGRYEIIDLGSHNGTFVNGSRIDRAELGDSDIISIGHATFRLADGELREYVDEGNVSFEARELFVQVIGRRQAEGAARRASPSRCPSVPCSRSSARPGRASPRCSTR